MREPRSPGTGDSRREHATRGARHKNGVCQRAPVYDRKHISQADDRDAPLPRVYAAGEPCLPATPQSEGIVNWRDLRLGPCLGLSAALLWLGVYLPVISNDRAVGIASGIVGAVFLTLIATGHA